MLLVLIPLSFMLLLFPLFLFFLLFILLIVGVRVELKEVISQVHLLPEM